VVKFIYSADLNQIAGALEIQLKRLFIATALVGGFFFEKSISIKNRAFNLIVRQTFVKALKRRVK